MFWIYEMYGEKQMIKKIIKMVNIEKEEDKMTTKNLKRWSSLKLKQHLFSCSGINKGQNLYLAKVRIVYSNA